MGLGQARPGGQLLLVGDIRRQNIPLVEPQGLVQDAQITRRFIEGGDQRRRRQDDLKHGATRFQSRAILSIVKTQAFAPAALHSVSTML